MADKISHKVYQKIMEEDIQMKPKHHFEYRSFFWKAAAAMVLLVASVILGSVFHFFSTGGFVFALEKNAGNFLKAFPFIPLSLAGVLVYLSSRLYRRSRICCRHEEWMLIASLVLVSVVLGFMLMSFGSVSYESEGILMQLAR